MTTCWLCHREIELDLTVRIDFYGIGPVDVCVFCVEKADELDPSAEDVA